MKEKILKEIEYIEFEINELNRMTDRYVNEYKEFVKNATADEIALMSHNTVFTSVCGNLEMKRQWQEKKTMLLRLIQE